MFGYFIWLADIDNLSDFPRGFSRIVDVNDNKIADAQIVMRTQEIIETFFAVFLEYDLNKSFIRRRVIRRRR